MRTGCYLRCDLIEMPLHGGGIASGNDHGRAGATGGTDGAECECRLGALIPGRRWLGYLVLLTNPGLILPTGSLGVPTGSVARTSAPPRPAS
jgi:hypothetical protein